MSHTTNALGWLLLEIESNPHDAHDEMINFIMPTEIGPDEYGQEFLELRKAEDHIDGMLLEFSNSDDERALDRYWDSSEGRKEMQEYTDDKWRRGGIRLSDLGE